MNKLVLVGLIIVGAIALLFFGFRKQPDEKSVEKQSVTPVVGGSASPTEVPDKNVLQLPTMEIDKSKKYTATLTTSKGVIKVELFADKTPLTVNNFVSLSRKNFYDNTVFHRVIKGFMIQGGDPNGDGTGGPGYKFDDEPFEGEYKRGTIAMANAGPNTNGSQFFIMHQDYPLPKNYVIFGQVVEGIDTVDKIAESPVQPSSSGENSKPVEPTVVKSVEITEE
ncbi:MAG: peptidylprolyl isomerase [bacterium]|nr:peptidylprolyl isomerase [bacterium]